MSALKRPQLRWLLSVFAVLAVGVVALAIVALTRQDRAPSSSEGSGTEREMSGKSTREEMLDRLKELDEQQDRSSVPVPNSAEMDERLAGLDARQNESSVPQPTQEEMMDRLKKLDDTSGN
jgi:hypothetical protein